MNLLIEFRDKNGGLLVKEYDEEYVKEDMCMYDFFGWVILWRYIVEMRDNELGIRYTIETENGVITESVPNDQLYDFLAYTPISFITNRFIPDGSHKIIVSSDD